MKRHFTKSRRRNSAKVLKFYKIINEFDKDLIPKYHHNTVCRSTCTNICPFYSNFSFFLRVSVYQFRHKCQLQKYYMNKRDCKCTLAGMADEIIYFFLYYFLILLYIKMFFLFCHLCSILWVCQDEYNEIRAKIRRSL